MGNRHFLPVGALIVSLMLFTGALVFALQATPRGLAVTPAVPQTAVSPITGMNGVVATHSTATSAPIVAATARSTDPDLVGASATATPELVFATLTPMPVAISPTPEATAMDVPTATAPPIGTEAAPAAGTPDDTLPSAIIPAFPSSTEAPAAPTNAPPVAIVPTFAPPTPMQAPSVQPTSAATPAPPTQVPPPQPGSAVAVSVPPVITGAAPRNVGLPVRVIIPSIGVDATIEQVGVATDGAMATPEDPWNTGWYAPGIRPGQVGNAAIAGHVDYHGIGPVVFWDLNKLSTGAEVFVVTDAGQTLRFTVRGSEYYTPENAPLQDIFGAATTLNLNLITCGGTFDPTTRHYDQRLVVFTSYAGR